MAQVFANPMVAHVWAQGRQDSGRSSNGQFFFTGRALYSYGSHHLVGWLMDSGDALINSDSRSVTTAKHTSLARRAVRGRVLLVPDLTRIATPVAVAESAQEPGREYSKLDEYARGRLDRARAEIVAHVEKHILGMTLETAGVLLTLAGMKEDKAIARASALQKRAEKAEAEKVAKAQRDRLAWHVARVRDVAKMTKAQWADHLAGIVRSSASNRLDSDLRAEAESLRRSLYHAARAKSPAKNIRDTARARMADLLAEADKVQKKRERAAAIGCASRKRRDLRAYIANPDSALMDALKRAESAVQFYMEHGRGLVSKVALDSLSSQIAGRIRDLNIRAQAEKHAAQAAERAQWLAGKPGRVYGLTCAQGGAMLRARDVQRDESGAITGGILETSQGASVPLTHAVRVFRFLKLCHETGQSWRANGRTIRVGHFRVESVSPERFTAGCHVIYWPEVERLARDLGIFDLPASDAAVEPAQTAA